MSVMINGTSVKWVS